MENENSVDIDDLHSDESLELEQNETTEVEEEDSVENIESDLKDLESDTKTDNEIEITGIEKFLSQHGIIGGIIEFEDGTKKHYNDLDQDEQFNVLKSIAQDSKSSVEQEYDLDPEEISLLNYIREQNKPVSEVIQDLVQEQLKVMNSINSSFNEDYNAMDSDTIYLKWLKDADPEATTEDLKEALDAAKKLKTFEKTTESLRKGFIQEQDRVIELEESRLEKERLKELEADRETIVNEVENIKHVAGWEVSDDQKNDILGDLLEVNSHGDSLFMEQVFSNPKILFEVAWFKKFGESHFEEMASYYKNQISEAYKKGKSDTINGFPSQIIKVGNNSSTKSDSSVQKREVNNAKDWESLHDDE
jgi:hypothetical protein